MKILLYITLIIFAGMNLFAETITYGGEQNDYVNNIIEVSSGGYLMAGSTDSFGNGSDHYSDAWIIKVDEAGEEVWSKTYGDADEKDGFYDIIESEKGFIAVGYNNNLNMWLVEFDQDGTVLWDTVYAGSQAASIKKIIKIDNDYIISGIGENNILKIDMTGAILWKIKLGYSINSLLLNTNDNILAAGESIGKPLEFGYIPTYYLAEISSDGTLIKTITNIVEDYGRYYCISSSNDGGCLVSGEKYNIESEHLHYSSSSIAKYDMEFSKLWEKVGEKYSSWFSHANTNDKIIAAGSKTSSTSYLDINLELFSDSGDHLYDTLIVESLYNYPSSIVVNNNQAVVVGQTESQGAGRYDAFLLLTTIPNPTTVNESSENSIAVFPNPCQEYININYTSSKSHSMSNLRIFDIKGNLVLSDLIDFTSGETASINTSFLPLGFYLIIIDNTELKFFIKK
jgi:type IX secretion system substrate protein